VLLEKYRVANHRFIYIILALALAFPSAIAAQSYHVIGAREIRATTDGVAPITDLVEYGDVDGDGDDDMVVFQQSAGKVFVQRNLGSGQFGPRALWHGWFAPEGEIPRVGDVNCDGLKDIVTFTMGGAADVWVAFSTGNGFSPSEKWHDWFAPQGELPLVANMARPKGPGACDGILTFTRSDAGHVYVAHSLYPYGYRSFGNASFGFEPGKA